jgi:hypothetical protein
MVALMKTEKARNAGISLYPSEIAKLRSLAGEQDNGNVAQFIRRILADDLTAPAAEITPDILLRLAAHYIPTEARKLPAALKTVDQPALLSRLLREFAECVADGIEPTRLHVAADSEISLHAVPFTSLRYLPRVPRSRLVSPLYPEPRGTDFSPNESPARV